jgi:glucose-6-phosphate isomerase
MSVSASAEYEALRAHHALVRDVRMVDLFAAEPERFARWHLRAGPLLLDFSKHRATEETLRLLMALARARGVEGRIRAMFAGERINASEDRAVLHVALRRSEDGPFPSGSFDVMNDVRRVRGRVAAFAEAVRAGTLRGATGAAFTDVVNIGIGGSDLGPKMVVRALAPYASPRLRSHFVSNVDPSDLSGVLAGLVPERTLFLVASKTFTTQETMANAEAARRWLRSHLPAGADLGAHFAAASTNEAAVVAFGIDPARMFGFWDWVGGRYSLWSAVGASIVLAVGAENFTRLLSGAEAIDRHLLDAPLTRNAPVIMAMLGVWYQNFFGAQTHAILPYDQTLEHFAAYFQQGDMESNGKSVTSAGTPVNVDTGAVVWGGVGTNAQHAFFQLLHQGTRLVPADFLAAARSHAPLGHQHEMLFANYLAQTQALMRGRSAAEVRAAHPDASEALVAARTFEGNRPSTSILYPLLTPEVVGALVALYEHKIFVQGVVWGINSFDQWGVELGKELASSIVPLLIGGGEGVGLDGSTRGLIAAFRAMRDSGPGAAVAGEDESGDERGGG